MGTSPQLVTYPRRRLFRSIFQFIVAVGPLAPLVYEQATQHDPGTATGLVGTMLAINAGLTRVMAMPEVEGFLQRFAPFLSATPKDEPIVGV